MRVAEIKMLPDGSGRVRIHYFVHDQKGPVTTPDGVIMSSIGPIRMGGVKGYIACQPERANLLPQMQGNVSLLTCHSDDARAATCPECLATDDWKKASQQLEELLNNGGALS